jgi:hypothetical protein
MASIPLPALSIRPPEQQDMASNLGRLMQLKQMAQEAPLRQQIMQQQAQEGQVDLAQKQQAFKDQQAMSKSMQQWDGSDLNSLVPLVVKNGASANAVMGLKQHILDQRKTYSQIASDDATTGAKNLDTLKGKNDMVAGAISTVMQLPDDQIQQGLLHTAQDLAQKGVLDPQHAQMAQQIAQSGDPNQIRQALDTFRKSSMSQTQLMDQATKEADLHAKETSTNWYAQNGGAPGVSAELQQQADWLKKNPGKGPSDYKLWMMKNSPSAVSMQNMFQGPGGQDALDLAARTLVQTGQFPQGISYRSPESQAAVWKRAAEIMNQTGGSLGDNKALYSSFTNSLKNMQKNFSQVDAFEQTAEKNIDLLQQTAQKIPDLGARFANIPVRQINANMIGTENMASFKTALATAQAEAAKVLNSANATGVLSDSARHDLQQIIDGNMPYKALVASLNTLKQDMANRRISYQNTIKDLQDNIGNIGNQGGNGNQPQNDPLGIR